MLRTSCRRDRLARAPATTTAAFLVATLLRVRALLSNAAFRKTSFDDDADVIEDNDVFFETIPVAVDLPPAIVFTLAVCNIFVCTPLPAAPATTAGLCVLVLATDFLSLSAAGLEAAAADAAAARRAARSELLTRRIVMPCLPLRTKFPGFADRPLAPEDARRATAARRAAAAAAAAATGPESKAARVATGCCGRRLRARMRVRFLYRTGLRWDTFREPPVAGLNAPRPRPRPRPRPCLVQ